jgi:hypothetical protein
MLNLKRTSAMACAQLRRNAPTRSRILSTKNLSTESCQPHIWVQNRQFTQSTVVAYARKASQDRNSINRESLEYSRSGSDDKTAALDDAAFNPDITDPDSQKKKAGEDSVSTFSHKPCDPFSPRCGWNPLQLAIFWCQASQILVKHAASYGGFWVLNYAH